MFPRKHAGLSSRRPWERPTQGGPGLTRVSLRFEAAPPEGPVQASQPWEDLLHGDAPWHHAPPPPTWCVPGPELFEGGLRIELPLLVSATDRGLALEDRVAVTGRVLASVIEGERARVGARLQQAATRSEALKDRGVRKGHRMRREGGLRALLGVALAWAAHLVHHLNHLTLSGVRGLTKGLTGFPDRFRTGWTRATEFLATPAGRKRFREGLRDPRNLSPRQKAVTLFLGVGAIVVGLVLVHAAVTLVLPQHAVAWRRMFLLFVYAFVTSLGPPLPLEPVLVGASLYVGRTVTIATALAAKVLAAWMVFFLGDEVNDKLRERQERWPWIKRLLDASEAFARRFGLFALALFIAIPGLPDVVALYLFGTLQMRLAHFLVGVFIGGLVLYTALLYGVAPLLGFH